MMLERVLMITVMTVLASLAQEDCEPCDQVTCPDVWDTCVAGVAPDRCGCCQVCARSEQELCDINIEDKYGLCGDNLECVYNQETQEQTCVCR